MERREAFKMYLKKGYEAEYERRHRAIWPEVVKELKKSGVFDYSIYLDKETDTLFAFQKCFGEASSQDLGATETIKKWWHYMADIMETNEDESPVSVPLHEVFHLD
jgi:L-rhamnose mutarotase